MADPDTDQTPERFADAICWKLRRDGAIEGWMAIDCVAHSHHVLPHVLFIALGLRPTIGQASP